MQINLLSSGREKKNYYTLWVELKRHLTFEGKSSNTEFRKRIKMNRLLRIYFRKRRRLEWYKKVKRSQEKMDKSSYNVAQKVFQLNYKEKQPEFYPKKMVICISKYIHICRYRYSNDNQIVETHMMLHKQMSTIAKLSRIAHIKRFL